MKQKVLLILGMVLGVASLVTAQLMNQAGSNGSPSPSVDALGRASLLMAIACIGFFVAYVSARNTKSR